MRISGEGIELL